MAETPPDHHRIDRLAAELGELSRRLEDARAELLSWPVAPAPTPQSSAPPPATEPAAVEPEPVEVAPSSPVSTPAPDRTRRDVSVLAWTGGAITLGGVVMFLVLAASRGWLGVPARLVMGAVLGLVLIRFGARLHRIRDSRTGAVALASTGFAALYLDVGAATAMYQYLPDPAGLAFGLLVAGAGLALADRWRSQPLAVGVVLGIGLLMPALYGGSPPLLVALVLVPQLVAAPVVLRRAWGWLAVTASVFPVVYGAGLVIDELLSSWNGHEPATDAVLAVVGVFVLGAGLAVLGARVLDPVAGAVRLVAAPAPALGLAAACSSQRGALIAGGVALALLLLAGAAALAPRLGWAPRHGWAGRHGTGGRLFLSPAFVGALVAGAAALFEATVLLVDGGALTVVLLGQAVVLMVLAAQARRLGVLALAGGYGVVGLVPTILRDAPVRGLAQFPAEPYFTLSYPSGPYWPGTIAASSPDRPAMLLGLSLSVLALVLATAALVAGRNVATARGSTWSAWFWAPVGAVGLYGAAGIVITSALLLAPSQAGFVGGHAVVTISWTLLGLTLLAKGIRLPALRIAGLVLVASAVTKLVLFDLVALDGLARVSAFVGAGLLLLAAGGRYARLVARSTR
jgi:uncharacterized membrane protein